jgi:hypothetical protein
MASLLEAVEFFPVISALLHLLLTVQNSLQKAVGLYILTVEEANVFGSVQD